MTQMDNEKQSFIIRGAKKLSNKTFIEAFQSILQTREFFLIAVILVMFVILSRLNPYFLRLSNFRSISRGFALEGIVIIGMTLLLISGEFDLSVGSVMALSGVTSALVIANGYPIFLGFLVGFLTGATTGLLNGFFITYFDVNPLIVTFGMLSIARGIALTITHGQPISGFPMEFIEIGRIQVFGFPLVLYIFFVLLIIFSFFMMKVRFFRQMYFIGGNEESARLSGINTNMMKIFAYITTGVLASLSGILSNARLMSAIPTAFVGVELKLIAAAIIGGCSLSGGKGTILGSSLGLAFMFLISNGMRMIGVSMYWENFVLGAILVIVVAVNMLTERRKEKRLSKA